MPDDSTTRQTLSFLMRRFAEAGIRPRTGIGQNFLIDLNLLGILADAADLNADDVVLEIGTGTGSLTALLAAKAAVVVTVEADHRMFQLAGEQLHDLPNVVMLGDGCACKQKSHQSRRARSSRVSTRCGRVAATENGRQSAL